MKVTLIIFTMNEIEAMKVVMPRIKKEWYDQLIIVDGSSTDGTIEYAREHGYFIFVQKEKGAGAAFSEAMEKATSDIVVTFSPDGNSIPEKIPELVDKVRQGYDLVTVSRYLDGAKSYDDDLITGFGNWLFTKFINLLFGVKYTDTLVMFRGFRRDIVKELGVGTKTPSWGTMLLLRATKKGLRIGEIPGDEPKRMSGERKMKPFINGTYELCMIIKEFFRV